MASAPSPIIAAAGLGALASATADTWATEIGMSSRATPRIVFTRRAVSPGTSGGITLPGTVGGIAGAMLIALGALLFGAAPGVALAVVAGGAAGMLADSAAGAWLQAERRCMACNVSTEQTVHRCGAPARHVRGLAWVDNDAVNAMATVAGGIVAVVVASGFA
jgi:uncharacterized protein (TIGR00297 family)